jgi:hypothetical protein
LVNTKQPKGMIKLFIQTIGKRKFTNWSRHLEEPYESRGSRTVVRPDKVDISNGCKSHQNKSQSSVAK